MTEQNKTKVPAELIPAGDYPVVSTDAVMDKQKGKTQEEVNEQIDNISDKEYEPSAFSGLGRKNLRKNVVGEKNVLTQAMMSSANTIYKIQYDYDLNGETITVPEGCILEFEGGSLRNGSIICNYLLLNDWKFSEIRFNDSSSFDFINPINVPIVNAKSFIETVLSHKSLTSTNPTIFIFGSTKPYSWNGTVNINRKNVKLTGGGTIQGHISIGYTKEDYTALDYDKYPNTGHHCISVDNLTFNKYNIIGSDTDKTVINDFIQGSDVTNIEHIGITITNVNHVKITNCFFDNVPFPIVYEAQSVFVNQHVRRLNISNCDFERCNIAVYADSKINSSLEYGDLEFNYNNVFPNQAGLWLKCIDGLKVYNNIFNTGGVDSINIFCNYCGQIMISGNSFYGEYNKHSLHIMNPGNLNINGNTFASQHIASNLPAAEDGAGIIKVQLETYQNITRGLSITGNLFTNFYGIPISIEGKGQLRGYTITGNTVDTEEYDHSDLSIYSVVGVLTTNIELQRSYTRILDNEDMYFKARVDAINTFAHNKPVRTADTVNTLKRYTFSNGESNIEFKVKSIQSCNPILILRPISIPPLKQLSFIFDGVYISLNLQNITTLEEMLLEIKEKIDSIFGDYFDTKIITSLLYIKGKGGRNIRGQFKCFRYTSNGVSTLPVKCVYQNLGYQVCLCDKDSKNHVRVKGDSVTYYSGLDIKDNHKILCIKNKLLTLECTDNENVTVSTLYPRNVTGSPLVSYIYIYNDTCLYNSKMPAGQTASVLQDIIEFCYSDRFTFDNNGTRITYKDVYANKEYSIVNASWECTVDTHVVNTRLLSSEGRVYDIATDTFSDP